MLNYNAFFYKILIRHSQIQACIMNTSRNSCQNETDIRNNNEELEELIGSNPHALSSAVSSTVAAVTSIFRWSPQQ